MGDRQKAMKNQDLEQRIIELETKVAFQDDTIAQLNDELSHHQDSIRQLQEQIRLLGSRFKEIREHMQAESEGSSDIVHEIPPHY